MRETAASLSLPRAFRSEKCHVDVDVALIRESYNLQDVVAAELGRPARRGGRALFWRCPFHADRTPSLAVYSDHFHCYGCGAHGDVITWVRRRDNLDFPEACRRLMPAGGAPPAGRPARREPPEPAWRLAAPPPDAWQEAAWRLVLAAYRALWRPGIAAGAAGAARAWLRARGLHDRTMQRAYVGYWDAGEATGRSGLPGAWAEHLGWVPAGVVIPHWHPESASLWGVKVRTFATPKYMAVKGSVTDLYGADSLLGRDSAFICEGELDALLLGQSVGDDAAVVTFGGAAVQDIVSWLPYLLPMRRLFVVTDNDAAGERAARRWLALSRCAVRVLPPGGAKDLTEAWQAGEDLGAWAAELLAADECA